MGRSQKYQGISGKVREQPSPGEADRRREACVSGAGWVGAARGIASIDKRATKICLSQKVEMAR